MPVFRPISGDPAWYLNWQEMVQWSQHGQAEAGTDKRCLTPFSTEPAIRTTRNSCMHALLLIAHGSRREASNTEVRELAARLEQISGYRFDFVIPAFLELAEPDIPTGVSLCAQAGATDVTAIPYFLSAGRHVASDIPAELEKAEHMHETVTIHHSNYLGKHESIAELLLTIALETGNCGRKVHAADATG
jgi:sirohydrochlorin ferrochelatase